MRGWKLGMMVLLLWMLVGCGSAAPQGEELALTARGGYLASQTIALTATVTADYGERVYTFSFDSVTQGETTTLTLLTPSQLAGLTVEVTRGESKLSYEGVWVDTGTLGAEGLTPVTAIPTILEGLRWGYIQSSQLEEGILTLICGDPDTPQGQGQELVLTLDSQGGDLLRGEIFVDGFRAIDCSIDSIHWAGMTPTE